MKKRDYTASLRVNATVQETFQNINSVPEWWSTNFEGRSEKLNDVFTVRFGEAFITVKIIELIPGSKIVWLVLDCNKPWLRNKKEWNGTKMSWEFSDKDQKTEIRFTHLGLVPEIECFDTCSNAWNQYLQQSLLSLINTGKGQPNP